MERFHEISDGAVITYSKDVYRQVKLYQREGRLYAAHGSGFVQLYARGLTGIPTMTWLQVDLGPGWMDMSPIEGPTGRLSLPIPRAQIAA